jgi:transcription termination factor Rho
MAVLERPELQASPLADLHAIADQLGLEGFRRLRKADLIDAILNGRVSDSDGEEEATGADGAGARHVARREPPPQAGAAPARVRARVQPPPRRRLRNQSPRRSPRRRRAAAAADGAGRPPPRTRRTPPGAPPRASLSFSETAPPSCA